MRQPVALAFDRRRLDDHRMAKMLFEQNSPNKTFQFMIQISSN